MISDAVDSARVSRVLGYKLKKGNFLTSSPNLPQRIALLGEANHANQSSLDLAAQEVTTAKQAGELYGYGSPIHLMMRILRPVSGDGVGGIPVVVYPQAEPGGAAYKVITLTPVGVATGNGTHYVTVAGRNGLDAQTYAINILKDDTVSDISQKIEDAINGVLSSPVTATSTDYLATLTSKWKGKTANELTVTVDTGDDDLGLSYVSNSTQSGSGTPDIDDALALFGNVWNTIVLPSYSTESAIMDALEAFNGIAGVDNPGGRYAPTVFKPFMAVIGTTAEDPSSITDTRDADMTIALAPAPLSKGFGFEAAANMVLLFARQAQNNPHLDVSGSSYPDMPVPADGDIGAMADYNTRDSIVKKGCSTVDLVSGAYQVQDFVTTYHPDGEVPPQFRYPRNINIDWNVEYGVFLLELINVVDHVIANDADQVSATKVVKPKQWKGVLNAYAEDLTSRALIVQPSFMQQSLQVAVSTTNPDRFETFFRYKRSGYARIISTDGEAGFNTGTQN